VCFAQIEGGYVHTPMAMEGVWRVLIPEEMSCVLGAKECGKIRK
jgi:hypothetical protein